MYSGTEAVAITGGESRNPKKDIPKALKQTFWRILIVYVGMVFFTSLIIPTDSEELLSATSKSASSPFTVALEQAGWSEAGNLINAIIVITLLSSINSAIYIGSRCIYAQAKDGRAPKFLGKTTSPWCPRQRHRYDQPLWTDRIAEDLRGVALWRFGAVAYIF